MSNPFISQHKKTEDERSTKNYQDFKKIQNLNEILIGSKTAPNIQKQTRTTSVVPGKKSADLKFKEPKLIVPKQTNRKVKKSTDACKPTFKQKEATNLFKNKEATPITTFEEIISFSKKKYDGVLSSASVHNVKNKEKSSKLKKQSSGKENVIKNNRPTQSDQYIQTTQEEYPDSNNKYYSFENLKNKNGIKSPWNVSPLTLIQDALQPSIPSILTNSDKFSKEIYDDQLSLEDDELCRIIHGIYDSESDDSGKNEFDEIYYKNQPPPTIIDTSKIVVVTPKDSNSQVVKPNQRPKDTFASVARVGLNLQAINNNNALTEAERALTRNNNDTPADFREEFVDDGLNFVPNNNRHSRAHIEKCSNSIKNKKKKFVKVNYGIFSLKYD